MDYQERIEKLDGFIKKCDDFNESIFEIGVFNLNDGIDDSKSIDRRDSNWRVFENNVNTYFRIYGNAERKGQFQTIIGRFDIDESVISDLIVLFNEMKDDIQIEIKKQVIDVNKDLYMSGGEKIEKSNNKIFIVHGRNEGVRDTVELLLRRVGLEPIILAEQLIVE